MIILYDNKFDDGVVTVPNENLYFGVDSLKNHNLSKLFQAESNDSYIDIDFETGEKIDSFFLIDHNFTENAVVKLQANDIYDFNSPPFEITLDIIDYMLYEYELDETYRYWRITFDDSLNLDPVTFARIMMGEKLVMPPMAKDQEVPKATTTKSTTNKTGQIFYNIGYSRKEAVVNFQSVSWDKKQEIERMFDDAGNSKPVIMVLWEDRVDLQRPLYVNIENETVEMVRTENKINPWGFSFNFREVF